jgi:transposase
MDAPITELTPITDKVPVKPRRRRHSLAFKGQVLAEVLAGQESVSVIARRHDINANLLFKWKRLCLGAGADSGQQTNMVPIQVADTPHEPVPGPMSPRRIDIVLGTDRWITVHGEVSRDALQTTLEALTR